jgi:hypothetical protein
MSVATTGFYQSSDVVDYAGYSFMGVFQARCRCAATLFWSPGVPRQGFSAFCHS